MLMLSPTGRRARYEGSCKCKWLLCSRPPVHPYLNERRIYLGTIHCSPRKRFPHTSYVRRGTCITRCAP